VKYARFLAARPGQVFTGLLLALLSGCTIPEEVPPPTQLLPKEKMVSLLVQLHLLEARIESSRLPPDSARALFQAQKKALLWKSGIKSADSLLEHSYRYYAVSHKDMDEIYKAVVDSLEHRETVLSGEKAPPAHPW
jgi:hypothetical protein